MSPMTMARVTTLVIARVPSQARLPRRLCHPPPNDVKINDEKSPLMVAVQKTTASLVKCFEGKQRKIVYPEFI